MADTDAQKTAKVAALDVVADKARQDAYAKNMFKERVAKLRKRAQAPKEMAEAEAGEGLGVKLDRLGESLEQSVRRIEAAVERAQAMLLCSVEYLDKANELRLNDLKRHFHHKLKDAEMKKPSKRRKSRLFKQALNMACQELASEQAGEWAGVGGEEGRVDTPATSSCKRQGSVIDEPEAKKTHADHDHN